jgi:hypothetical protein
MVPTGKKDYIEALGLVGDGGWGRGKIHDGLLINQLATLLQVTPIAIYRILRSTEENKPKDSMESAGNEPLTDDNTKAGNQKRDG